MKSLIFTINFMRVVLLAVALSAVACKKSDPPARQNNNTITQYQPDTSHNGKYRMIYCSVLGELDTTLLLTCKYQSYYIDSSQSTTDAYLKYSVLDGKSPLYYCYLSKTVQWHPNQGTPNQAYVISYKGIFTSAFVQDTRVTYSTNGKFSGDTLILPVTISPVSGSPYFMLCKYKR